MDNEVVIVGGGIIGLCSAYYLRKNGAKVTILEKGEFADACSKGNQGWVCPALHSPVPEPGLVGTSIKTFFKKDNPLYIKPSAAPRLSGWLMQFMKYCNEKAFKAAEQALNSLSRSTFELYDALEADGLNFEMYRDGMLFVFLNESALQQNAQKFHAHSKEYGHEAPIILSGAEVRELEPGISDAVVGGILLENQRHIRPESFAEALTEKLESIGVDLKPNTEVTEIERQGNEVIAVKSRTERFEVGSLLLATGAWSGYLAKKLGYPIPLEAGKGYSITLSNPNINFNHPLYLGDSKAGMSPFDHSLRIGGTMELSGINSNLDKNRILGVRNAVSKYVKIELKAEIEEEWTGMRPMTPDGLPVLGQIPNLKNTYIATGHGMVGVAMSPVTGKVMADLICSGETDIDLHPFDPNRFVKENAQL